MWMTTTNESRDKAARTLGGSRGQRPAVRGSADGAAARDAASAFNLLRQWNVSYDINVTLNLTKP